MQASAIGRSTLPAARLLCEKRVDKAGTGRNTLEVILFEPKKPQEGKNG